MLIVRRVATIEVEVVDSSPARDSFFRIGRPKLRERELAKFDAKRPAYKT